MDIVSTGPLRTGSVLWRAQSGAFMLTVACKATYEMLPGASRLAPDQDPLNETDNYWNDDERRSLHAASDLAPFKRRADVILVGHAYAPGGQPVSSLLARLVVGSVNKAIEVRADRTWTQDGALLDGPRFVKMSLRWEKAAGGPDTSNPVGMRPDARPDPYGRVAVPNLEPPGFYLAQPGQAIPPVGFGPIAPWWPTRWEKLYRRAGLWDYRTWAERPLPEDIDAAFFNVAPPDQQIDEIRSDERIVMENLHAEHARLVTSLPGLAPRAVVERAGAASQDLRLRCDTLWVDTDRGVCSVVWRGQVALARADERGRVEISAGGAEDEAVQTLVGEVKATMLLPFGQGAVGAGPQADEDAAKTTMSIAVEPAGPALPFKVGNVWASAAALPAPIAPPPRGEDDGTGTIFAIAQPGGAVLPFAGVGRAGAAPEVPVQAAVHVPAFMVAPEVQVALRVEAEVAVPREAPAPPPMIGPLALNKVGTDTPGPEVASRPEIMAPTPEQPTEGPLPLAEFPIQRCASMAASMARRGEERARILEESRLTAEQWASLTAHWAEEIRKSVKRGKAALLETYDKAYVGRLEEERGTITVEEHARLVVAAERGMLDEVSCALDVPAEGFMRVRRIWMDRCARDPALGAVARRAIAAERERD